MAITKLNQGVLAGPNSSAFHPYHYTVAATDVTARPELGHLPGTTAQAYNEDTLSAVTLIWAKAGEALFPGALCVLAEDFVATAVDAGNIGLCGVAIGNGAISATITSGDWGWFGVVGQFRIHSDDVAAGTALYIDGSNPGGVDDAAVTGDQVNNAFAMEADVVSAGAYNTTTTKCMIAWPNVDSISPTAT